MGNGVDASPVTLGASQPGIELYLTRSHGLTDIPLINAPAKYKKLLATMCVSFFSVVNACMWKFVSLRDGDCSH